MARLDSTSLASFLVGAVAVGVVLVPYVHQLRQERDGRAIEVQWIKENFLTRDQIDKLKDYEDGWEPDMDKPRRGP